MGYVDLSRKIHLLQPESAFSISPPRETYPRPTVRQVWDLLGREVGALTWDWPEPQRVAGGVVLVPGPDLEEWKIRRDIERVTGLA